MRLSQKVGTANRIPAACNQPAGCYSASLNHLRARLSIVAEVEGAIACALARMKDSKLSEGLLECEGFSCLFTLCTSNKIQLQPWTMAMANALKMISLRLHQCLHEMSRKIQS